MSKPTVNPNENRADHQPSETQKECIRLCGPRNFGYHVPECPIVLAALAAPSGEQG